MSQMGWRWFGVSSSGAVESFFQGSGCPWPTDEPYHAECRAGAWLKPSQYGHDQHEPEMRIRRAESSFGGVPDDQLSPQQLRDKLGMLRNPIPMDRCPECSRGSKPHQIAQLECTCGIYVFKWSEDALALPYVSGYRKNCQVFGVVEWWGHYSEHDLGYRVEWAQLRAIHAWGKGTKVHASYQIDRVRDRDTLIERYEPDYAKEGE